jgi:hypothetical protein
MTETSAFGLDLSAVAGNAATPSPSTWEDEIFYFLLVDRFSDGKEDGYRDLAGNLVAGTTPMYSTADNGDAVTTSQDATAWSKRGRSSLAVPWPVSAANWDTCRGWA